MWRLSLDTIGVGILLVMLLALMFAVLILQRQRTGKTIAVWLAAGLIGILLGLAGTLGALRLSDYRLMSRTESAAAEIPGASAPAGMSAPGGGTEGVGGGPNPKRDLTTLVRKIDLLTGEIGIRLNPEQGASLAAALADVEQGEAMSDDDAKAKHEAILTLLDDAQKSQLEAIGLPRPQRGAGGGGPGDPAKQAPPNPFQDEAAAKSVQNLRERLAPKKAESDSSSAKPKE